MQIAERCAGSGRYGRHSKLTDWGVLSAHVGLMFSVTLVNIKQA